MLYIFLFIFALSLIIALHEFGHLLAAKKFGVYCYEYSIGMGPKICSKKFKETQYSLRLIPFGGYVAMAGEGDQNEEFGKTYGVENVPFERTLPGISKPKRIIVLLAGIFMNFVLAYVIFCFILLHNGKVTKERPPVIEGVVEKTPAAKSGLKQNDIIKKLTFEDGTIVDNPKTVDDFVPYIATKGGKIKIDVLRNNEIKSFEVESVKNGEYYNIGIKIPEIKYVTINVFNVFKYASSMMFNILRMMFVALANLLRGIGLNDVSGPLGIYQATARAASEGAVTYFYFIALLSLNVGILNAFPIPALDGGRVLLVLIEAIIRKPINKKIEYFLIVISMMFLIGLMVLATFKDIINFF